jgi:hypothetical protein
MGVVLAWLVGEGIVTWRWVKNGAPPTPGALLMSSGFFALLALLYEYPPARTAATLTAVGVDVAVLLQVLGKDPGQVTGWPPPPITPAGEVNNVILPTGTASGETPSQASQSTQSKNWWQDLTGYLGGLL